MKTYQGVVVHETLAEIVDPGHTCLVAWDVQQVLTARVFDPGYVARLGAFIRALRGRVPVLFTLITTPPAAFQSPWSLHSRMRRMGVDDPSKLPPFPAPGSPEAGFPAELAPEEGDWLVPKTTPSLFVGTPVEAALRARGVRTLLFTGIATEIGVETSVRHAAALGFYPVVVRDGVCSMDRGRHERSLEAMQHQAIVADAAEILSALSPAPRA